MRQKLGFALVVVFMGWVISGAGTAVDGRVSGDEATVRSLDDQEREAVLERDVAALERLWSDQFTVNAPSNQVLVGKREVLALVDRGVINYSSFERRVELVRLDGEIAIVMGAETVQPIGDAPRAGQTVERRFTNIWKKDGATWRLTARHANVVAAR